MIVLKSASEVGIMKAAGKIVGEILDALAESVKPGVTDTQLEAITDKIISRAKAGASFKGYRGFPSSICVSINNEVVHGIPSGRELKEGDIVSCDVGALYKGYNADAARTFAVGKIADNVRKLIDTAKESFFEGLKYCREGYRISDISHAIGTYVESKGYGVVRELSGHGIGQKLHESPEILNFGLPHMGPRIKEGMALAIEPMITLGDPKVFVADDKWTVCTLDLKPAAHYENTVIVTSNGPKLLTITDSC